MPTAAPVLLVDADWSKGQIRDAPRGSIPEGAVFNSVDYLLHKPGMAQKRGGTEYAGPVLSGATYTAAVCYAPYSTGSKLLAIGDDGHLYDVTAGVTTDLGTLGSAFLTLDTPKYRVGASRELMVFMANDGTTIPKFYGLVSGSMVLADVEATMPPGKYAAVYKTRFVVANTDDNKDRLFFGPVPNIRDTWDTDNSWIDTDFEVTGLAALQNALVIFSLGKTQRITGSTPPPGTDMDRAPVGDVGCSDARSIIVYEGNAIFCNQRAVWSTNGSSFQNLTKIAGNETYWQSILEDYDAATWTISSGVYGTYLVVVVMNGQLFVDCLVFSLARPAWWRFANIEALMFASSLGAQDELYYADRNVARVTKMRGTFLPSAANKNDANGDPVQPVLETRLIGGGPTLKHFGHARISMDMRDAATDDPTMAVTVAPGLEATTFSNVPESPLPETTDNTRKRFAVNKVSQGVTLRLAQTGASSKTEIYAIEVEARGLNPSAGGQ